MQLAWKVCLFSYIYSPSFPHSIRSDIARQYQLAKKLPYIKWIFPNTLEHRNAMKTA